MIYLTAKTCTASDCSLADDKYHEMVHFANTFYSSPKKENL
jgi:hypothetical protein